MTSTKPEFIEQSVSAPEWIGDFADLNIVKCHNPGPQLKIPVKKNPLVFTAVIVSIYKRIISYNIFK